MMPCFSYMECVDLGQAFEDHMVAAMNRLTAPKSEWPGFKEALRHQVARQKVDPPFPPGDFWKLQWHCPAAGVIDRAISVQANTLLLYTKTYLDAGLDKKMMSLLQAP